MSKFFRGGDDLSDWSSEEDLESYTEESSDHDSDEAREDSDDSDEGIQDCDDSDEGSRDSDEGVGIPDEEGDFWHFSGTFESSVFPLIAVTSKLIAESFPSDSDDSGCDMPRRDRRRYRTQPAPSYGGARLCTGPSDTDTDSDMESEDEKDVGATPGPRPICQWRGSRLMNYIGECLGS